MFPLVQGTISCFLAFLDVGRNPAILKLYVSYFASYTYILVLSLGVLSSTYWGLGILFVMVCLGPTVFIMAPLASILGIVLYLLNLFPTSILFNVGRGILSPFVNLPVVCYLITNLLAPLSSTEFVLVSLELPQSEVKRLRARSKTTFLGRLLMSLEIFFFDLMVRYSMKVMVILLPHAVRSKADFVVSAFLLSFRLVSVYNMNVMRHTFFKHVLICVFNVGLLVGFGAPIELLRRTVVRGEGEGERGAEHLVVMAFLEMGFAFALVGRMVKHIEL